MLINDVIQAVNDLLPRNIMLVNGVVIPRATIIASDLNFGSSTPTTFSFMDAAGNERQLLLARVRAFTLA